MLTEKPTAGQLAEDYEIHISAAEELLRDGEYDDGDGDYDWEVLTATSSKKIKDFVASLNASQKEYKISWTTGEKNWITVYISKVSNNKNTNRRWADMQNILFESLDDSYDIERVESKYPFIYDQWDFKVNGVVHLVRFMKADPKTVGPRATTITFGIRKGLQIRRKIDSVGNIKKYLATVLKAISRYRSKGCRRIYSWSIGVLDDSVKHCC